MRPPPVGPPDWTGWLICLLIEIASLALIAGLVLAALQWKP